MTERVASIRLKGFDQVGLVNRLTEIVSNQLNVNMRAISFETEDGIFEGRIKVLVFDTIHLQELMSKFELVEGVQRVERWDDQTQDFVDKSGKSKKVRSFAFFPLAGFGAPP